MLDLIQQEEEIFCAAWNLADPEARRALLDHLCGNDLPLRTRVENRLKLQVQAEEFFAAAAPHLK